MPDPVIIAASAMVALASAALLLHGERKNIVYARLHMASVVDFACLTLIFWMGYPFIGAAYLLLTPLCAHSIANAHSQSEGVKR